MSTCESHSNLELCIFNVVSPLPSTITRQPANSTSMSSLGQRVRARFKNPPYSIITKDAQSHLSHPKSPTDKRHKTLEETATPPDPRKSPAELAAITQQNQQTSPFLRLPGEIRNTIYHYALAGHEIYAMPSGLTHRPFTCQGRPTSQFAWSLLPISQLLALHLPLVCRQIRAETGKYFVFKFNEWGSTMPEYFELLMGVLTQEQRGRIEVVRINWAGMERGAGRRVVAMVDGSEYAALGGLRNLKVVVLRDFGGMDGQMREKVVRVFRELAGKKRLEVRVESIG
ncbi:hypothetical protein N0V83_004164 [Neocucurbitaria cava]|uniref:Uncharacterized protein n=1 Tax=Neocucurbitaria cava TaxID=798079 RepID=A0A9W8YB17_9PLEO|nr:hypothetical protein N0V83_004164 [Neocucurbitaria cava]